MDSWDSTIYHDLLHSRMLTTGKLNGATTRTWVLPLELWVLQQRLRQRGLGRQRFAGSLPQLLAISVSRELEWKQLGLRLVSLWGASTAA